MKKHLLYLIVVLAFLGCKDNSGLYGLLTDYDARITTLEEFCRQMNTNISSMEQIVQVLQTRDYVTNISEIKNGSDIIGYTISFAQHPTITIYKGNDGKDGKDGVDGKDGENGISPVVGFRQDTDGIYYWTLNGNWMLNDQGEKVPTTGQNGTNGITPKLKIENNFWYLSYDNGSTWTLVSKAVGENGKDGKDGKDGINGANGTNGTDGITPNLKIENGYLYVSYDNGSSWSQLGLVKGADGINGTNGTNGTNGKDGITPVFKIENGKWYVSYDNETSWSYMGQATGANGQDGKDGTNGTNGTDGVTPQLKIENDSLFASYNNGLSWTNLGYVKGATGASGQNGKDGTNGNNGTDGVTPQLKIENDSLFASYNNGLSWTNLGYVKGATGAAGQNGTNGTNGTNGITPMFKIEADYWYVSYDNGSSWSKLSKATGADGKDGKDGKDGQDGQDGEDGEDGDSMFQSVTQDDNFAYFTLADGTVIKIAKNSSVGTGEIGFGPGLGKVTRVDGAIRAAFSVSDSTKVYFSQGNLQYNAVLGTHKCADGSTQQGTWRFAERQYDICGEDNANISSTYDGWIDLFGWGTSGWDNGNQYYQPYCKDYMSTPSTNGNIGYGPGYRYSDDYSYSLVGNFKYADWGIYNAISNGGNAANQWRTLTEDEIDYLLVGREHALALQSRARLILPQGEYCKGIIIFPDEIHLTNINFIVDAESYDINIVDSITWKKLENAGAVFLPIAGYRDKNVVVHIGIAGYYWTSTKTGTSTSDRASANYWQIIKSGTLVGNPKQRSNGCSVRLVQDVNE